MIELLFAVLVIGAILYAVKRLPVDESIKVLVTVVGVLIAVALVLGYFGHLPHTAKALHLTP